MIIFIGLLLVVQIYLLGYTNYLSSNFYDSTYQILYIFQYLFIGITMGFFINIKDRKRLMHYIVISLPLLFLANFRWIFLNTTIMSFLKVVISHKVADYLLAPKVAYVSWILLGMILFYIIKAVFLKNNKYFKLL